MFNYLIETSFLTNDKKFDVQKLTNKIETISENNEHEITLIGRFQGLELESDLIELLDEYSSLVCLNTDEINDRQPFILGGFGNDRPSILDYSKFNAEIRIKDTFLYENYVDFWKPKLFSKLEQITQAVKLTYHGRFYVYPVSFYSSLLGKMGVHHENELRFINGNIKIDKSNINELKKSFDIVENISCDEVLKRSFSRFLLGLDERMPEEQLVDFVIAWESILQTVNGTSNKTELSYRFSLNGATILCVVDNTRKFTEMQTFMKETYNIRSTIVHGGDVKSVKACLQKIKMDSLIALNNELANLYPKTINWLSSSTREERPYYKSFGWELLIPEAFKNNQSL